MATTKRRRGGERGGRRMGSAVLLPPFRNLPSLASLFRYSHASSSLSETFTKVSSWIASTEHTTMPVAVSSSWAAPAPCSSDLPSGGGSPVVSLSHATNGSSRLAQYASVRRLRKTLYGETMLCRDTISASQPQKLVVLKRMNLHALRENSVGAHENPLEERRVIQILQRHGGHANVVSYEPREPMFVSHGDLYTVMEFCADGDLFDHLERSRACESQGLPEREALKLIHQIALGLEFLHGQGIAHRDLSLENVLLHNGTAKICDFGLSCDASGRYKDVVGKVGYMAPEIARGEWYDAKAADVWSLGVMLFSLLTGSPLVAEEPVREKMVRVIAKYGIVKVLELWGMLDRMSTGTLALLDALLQVSPTKRLRVEGVLSHPVFWTITPTSP